MSETLASSCRFVFKKNVSDDFPLEVNQEMLKWESSFCPRRILQSSDVAELLSKSPCWIEQKLFKVNSVIFTTIKSSMYVRQFRAIL